MDHRTIVYASVAHVAGVLRDVQDLFERMRDTAVVRGDASLDHAFARTERSLQHYRTAVEPLLAAYEPAPPEPPPFDPTERSDASDISGVINGIVPSNDAAPGAQTTAVQEGYAALQMLAARYVALYTVGDALMEPRVSDVALRHFRGLRALIDWLFDLLPAATVADLAALHPDLVLNVTAGEPALRTLRLAWRPTTSDLPSD